VPSNPPHVVIRAIRPSDRELLAAGMAKLSPESARRRFLTAKSSLSARELTYLTEVDGRDHVALVAVMADAPGELAAVGRFVRLPEDPTTAEVAIVVADELQGRGLGRRIGVMLADEARALGIERFSATLLSDNAAAHRLFAAISRRLRSHHVNGLEELVAELPPPLAAVA
jgi:RimJ/RimL family protein N-acetyltransferase